MPAPTPVAPWEDPDTNISERNNDLHKSGRQYFINQREIIKDWAPRSLEKRKEYLKRKKQFVESRDPAFVNPEKERGWNHRAGIEGSSYNHQVHVYRRYRDGGVNGPSTHVGIASSASEGESPFLSSQPSRFSLHGPFAATSSSFGGNSRQGPPKKPFLLSHSRVLALTNAFINGGLQGVGGGRKTTPSTHNGRKPDWRHGQLGDDDQLAVYESGVVEHDPNFLRRYLTVYKEKIQEEEDEAGVPTSTGSSFNEGQSQGIYHEQGRGDQEQKSTSSQRFNEGSSGGTRGVSQGYDSGYTHTNSSYQRNNKNGYTGSTSSGLASSVPNRSNDYGYGYAQLPPIHQQRMP